MSALMFGKVRAVNFGPFADVLFDLSKPGLTVIEGEMKGVPGCNDNGSGKSFVLECIPWATFDRCMRADYTGDDVVRHDSKNGTMVEVNLVGRDAYWRRYRNHPVHKNKLMLWIDGKEVTAGTNPETQILIERLLGYDFAGYTAITAFGDVKSFFAANDTDRKRVLDAILRLDRFDAAQVVAMAKLKESTAKSAELESAHSAAEAKRAGLYEAATEEVIDSTELLRMKVRLKKHQTELDALDAPYGEAECAQEAAEIAYEKLQRDQAKAQQVASQERAKASMLKGQADGQVNACAGQLVQAEKELATIDSRIGEPCDACGQVVGPECLDGAVKAQKKKISDLKVLLAERKKSAALVVVPPAPPAAPPLSTAAIQSAQTVVSELRGKRDVFTQLLSSLQAEVRNTEAAIARAAAVQAKIAEQEAIMANAKTELETVAERMRVLAFWVEGFGKSGLKSFLLECELSEINATATKYAQRLLGSGARITLAATRKLKTKAVTREELSVSALIPGCTKRYAGASKGQKRRLDLALLLALRDVASSRSGVLITQFFADEVFDGVDKAGCDTVSALLKDLSTQYPISLVTHTNALKSGATRVIRVIHSGETAIVVAA